MTALYGTLLRYETDVMTKGVTRESAAVFLLPNFLERAIALRTVACTIYHAFGLDLLRKAVKTGQRLDMVLSSDGGGACIICICGVSVNLQKSACYTLDDGETYPYVKIKDIGSINSQDKLSIHLDMSSFQDRIDGETSDGGFRFFQKVGGSTQRLPGCNMRLLNRLCIDEAERILWTYSDYFREERIM